MLFAAVHESAFGRFCCKRPKSRGDNCSARRRDKPLSPIDIASGSLPKSPVSSSLCDEVPHIFTRKPRLQLGKFVIICAKRLLQQNRHLADNPVAPAIVRFWMPDNSKILFFIFRVPTRSCGNRPYRETVCSGPVPTR